MLSLDRQNALRERYRRLHPGWQPATETYAGLVRAHLTPTARVLDLGCGRGGLVEQLNHPLAQIAGLDPDLTSLQEHRLPLPRAAGFSDALPFAGATFDLIFCSWLLEHLADPDATFAEMGRVLRPGGVFVFITPNGRHPLAWLNRLLGRVSVVQDRLVAELYGRPAADTFPTHFCANTPAALTRLAKAHGMALATLHAIPDPTYLAFTPALFRLSVWLEEALPNGRAIHLVGVAAKASKGGAKASG